MEIIIKVVHNSFIHKLISFINILKDIDVDSNDELIIKYKLIR